MFEKVLTIDPGASSLKLYEPAADEVVSERTVMASRDGKQYVGEEAFELFWEKGSGVLKHPVDQGMLAGDLTPLFMKLVSQAQLDRHLFKPSLRVLLTREAKEEQMEKWIRMGEKAGFRRVLFSDPVNELKKETGLVIHAGFSYTRLAAFRSGHLLDEKKIIFAGRQIDEAIMEYVANTYRSLMFYEDAAALKKAASDAFWNQKNPVLSCVVLDQRSQYVRLSIRASELWPAISGVLKQIVMWARELVSQLGLENMEEVLKYPVYLTGGLANCYGLRQMLEEQLNTNVIVLEEPENWLVKNAHLKNMSGGNYGRMGG